MYTFMLVIHTLIALGIAVLVLIQRSDNDGFGLSGGGNSMMSSAGRASFFTRGTAILATCFFITSLVLTMLVNQRNQSSLADRLAVPVIEQPTEAVPAEALPAEGLIGDVPLADQ